MKTAIPGSPCPQSGIWVPCENPNFYPQDYAQRVMQRRFEMGDVMSPTPHGEPHWALQEDGTPLQNFTGLSVEQIADKLK